MAANAAFASALVRTEMCQVSAANTLRDGTGTLVSLFTAGASGSRLERITIVATGTTTAGMIRLFLRLSGTTRLWKEYQVTAATPSGSALAYNLSVNNLAFIMATGWQILAATNNAETFNLFAEAGDF